MIAKDTHNMANSCNNYPILYKPNTNFSSFSFFFKKNHCCKPLYMSKLLKYVV